MANRTSPHVMTLTIMMVVALLWCTTLVTAQPAVLKIICGSVWFADQDNACTISASSTLTGQVILNPTCDLPGSVTFDPPQVELTPAAYVDIPVVIKIPATSIPTNGYSTNVTWNIITGVEFIDKPDNTTAITSLCALSLSISSISYGIIGGVESSFDVTIAQPIWSAAGSLFTVEFASTNPVVTIKPSTVIWKVGEPATVTVTLTADDNTVDSMGESVYVTAVGGDATAYVWQPSPSLLKIGFDIWAQARYTLSDLTGVTLVPGTSYPLSITVSRLPRQFATSITGVVNVTGVIANTWVPVWVLQPSSVNPAQSLSTVMSLPSAVNQQRGLPVWVQIQWRVSQGETSRIAPMVQDVRVDRAANVTITNLPTTLLVGGACSVFTVGIDRAPNPSGSLTVTWQNTAQGNVNGYQLSYSPPSITFTSSSSIIARTNVTVCATRRPDITPVAPGTDGVLGNLFINATYSGTDRAYYNRIQPVGVTALAPSISIPNQWLSGNIIANTAGTFTLTMTALPPLGWIGVTLTPSLASAITVTPSFVNFTSTTEGTVWSIFTQLSASAATQNASITISLSGPSVNTVVLGNNRIAFTIIARGKVTVPSLTALTLMRGTSNTFTVTTDRLPIGATALTVTPNPPTTGITFTPTKWTMTRTDASLSQKFTIVIGSAVNLGSYSVTWSTTGNTEFASISASTITVSAPPPMSVSSVRFSDSLVRVVITFNQATNTPGIATPGVTTWPKALTSCAVLFDTNVDDNSKLGSDAICQWSSTSVVEILLASSATVTVGDLLTIQSDVVSDATENVSFGGGPFVVTTAVTPIVPSVVLTVPVTVGYCSSLLLDARITNNVIRSLSATWSYSVTSSHAPSTAAINNYLASVSGTHESSPTINATMMVANIDYTFTVTVTNFIGITSAATIKTVHKSSAALPLLTISGLATITRSSPITLRPSLSSTQSCYQLSSQQWSYTWSIASTLPSTGSPLQPVSVMSAAIKDLVLPSLSLSSGYIYTFKVNASSITAGASVTATIDVKVTSSPLFAIIAGGNRVVSPSIATTLDGTGSKDPDVVSGGLVYDWSCALASSASCGLSSSISLSGSTLSLPADALAPLSSYTFILVITSTDGVRTASTSVVITTSAAPAPTTPVISVKFIASAAEIADGNVLVIAGNAALRLQGSVTLLQGSATGRTWSYSWSEASGLDLSSRTSEVNSPNLVLPAGVLTSGIYYTFRLTVSLNSGSTVLATSYAEVVRFVAMPPSSSSAVPFAIVPSTGVAVSTVFTFLADGWDGEFDPLTYTFKQLLSSGVEIPVGSGAALSGDSTTSFLPAGDITIVLYVTDSQGVSTRVTSSVTVTPAIDTSSQSPVDCTAALSTFVANVTATVLRDALAIQNAGQAVDIIRILAGILNNATASGCTVGDDVRNQLLQTIVSVLGQSNNDQLAAALDQVTSQGLTNSTIGTTLNVIQQILDSILNGGSNPTTGGGGSTTPSLTGVLSNVVGSNASCSALTDVGTLASRVVSTSLTGLVAGESPVVNTRDNLVLAGQRSFTSAGTTPTLLVLGGSGVQISSDAIQSANTDSDYADIQVIQYGASSNIISCYNTTVGNETSSNVTLPVDTPLTPITDITIVDSKGNVTNVTNLNQPVLFNLPISQTVSTIAEWATKKCAQKALTCSWFDHSINAWSTEGCSLVSTAASNVTTGSSVTCSCNHLTEFAILARSATTCDVSTDEERMVYAIFAVVYLVVALITIIQLVRIVKYSGRKCRFDLLSGEHICVLAVTAFRCATLVFRAELSWSSVNINDLPIVGVGLLTAVPYMFQFIAYTFLVATWASVYHFAMQNKGQSPFAKLRVPFIIANTCIALLVFGLFGGLAGTSDEDAAKRIVIGGTCAMAFLTVTMSAVYLIYGRGLIATLSKTGGANASKSPVVRNLYNATAAFCTCFIAESALWIISVGLLDTLYTNDAPILAAYYGINVISMFIILNMFRSGVNKLAPKSEKSSHSGHSTGSKTNLTRDRETSSHGSSPDRSSASSRLTSKSQATTVSGGALTRERAGSEMSLINSGKTTRTMSTASIDEHHFSDGDNGLSPALGPVKATADLAIQLDLERQTSGESLLVAV